jgi:hypothetical protein
MQKLCCIAWHQKNTTTVLQTMTKMFHEEILYCKNRTRKTELNLDRTLAEAIGG